MNYDPQDPRDIGVHRFLVNSYQITREARFVVMSIPNADRTAVERFIRQLESIRRILVNLDDRYLTQDDIAEMITQVNNLLDPLEEFIDNPPPHPASYLPRNYTGRPGRPAYILDIPRAICLHNLGASWVRVAHAMGVARQTLYSHLQELGFSTARPVFTEITDDDLDEIVAEISLEHPFDGSGIMRGHLKSRGINLSILRVQESLKRVDPLGVLSRYGSLDLFGFVLEYTLIFGIFILSLVGQVLSVVVFIMSGELCPCGIRMAMRSFGRGVSGYMDVLMVTLAFSSTSRSGPIKLHERLRVYSSSMSGNLDGRAEYGVIMGWRIMVLRGK